MEAENGRVQEVLAELGTAGDTPASGPTMDAAERREESAKQALRGVLRATRGSFHRELAALCRDYFAGESTSPDVEFLEHPETPRDEDGPVDITPAPSPPQSYLAAAGDGLLSSLTGETSNGNPFVDDTGFFGRPIRPGVPSGLLAQSLLSDTASGSGEANSTFGDASSNGNSRPRGMYSAAKKKVRGEARSWSLSGPRASGKSGGYPVSEEAVSEAFRRCPIVDITAVYGSDSVPEGYFKLARTVGGRKADLNSGAGGNYLYLCIKKDITWEKVPVVGLIVIFPDRQEYVPPTFSVIKRKGQPIDLNHGTNGERMYLCYKKGAGNPVSDLQVIFPRKKECTPRGYSLLELSPLGHEADLNAGTGGLPIRLAYKQQLVKLQALRSAENSELPLEFGEFVMSMDPLHFGSSNTLRFKRRGPSSARARRATGERMPGFHREQSDPTHRRKSSRVRDSSGSRDPSSPNLPAHGLRSRAASERSPPDSQGLSLTEVALQCDAAPSEATPTDDEEDGGLDSFDGTRDDESGVDGDEGSTNSFSDASWGLETGGGAEEDPATEVWDAGGAPVSARLRDMMFLLLTGLYVRHEGVAEATMREVTRLLIDSDFFSGDLLAFSRPGVHRPPAPPAEAAPSPRERPSTEGRLLLDFAVEAYCDQCDQVCEAHFPLLLQFLRAVVQRSNAALSSMTLRYVFRTYSFLCGFYASASPWMRDKSLQPFSEDDAAYVCFRELVTTVFKQAEDSEEGEAVVGRGVAPKEMTMWDMSTPLASAEQPWGPDGSPPPSLERGHQMRPRLLRVHTDPGGAPEHVAIFVREVIWHAVSSAVDMVELAKVTEKVLDAVKRHTYSESFWSEATQVGDLLFPGQRPQSNAFVVLATLCKTATRAVRTLPSGEMVARDLGIKILSLDLLHELLRISGEKMRRNRIFGYQIRRLVVAIVLSNAADGLADERALQLLLGIVSMLWKHHRRHCKVEIVVLLENIIFRMLRSPSGQVLPTWRILILDELLKWFDIPHNLVELFLNYDMDRRFIQQWKIFKEMCATMCNLAEGYSGDAKIRMQASGGSAGEQDRNTLRMKALKSVAQIVKSLMDASGHGHLIARDPRTREMSLAINGGWEEDETSDDDGVHPLDERARKLLSESERERGEEAQQSPQNQGPGRGPELALPPPAPQGRAGRAGSMVMSLSEGDLSRAGGGAHTQHRPKRPNSFRYRKELRKRAEEVIKQALELYHTKGLKKAVQYLVASNFISDTPRDIANFLRFYQDELDPASIGDFLSEPDLDKGEYWRLIRLQYVRAISFHGMALEDALRHLLTNSGFRLPGEAQKVDRLLSAFAECYFADNKGNAQCPFSSFDTPFVLSYAIIMLNTDLHKANDGKKRKHMSKEAFISNLRGVADIGEAPGQVSAQYLSDIYDSIQASPIAMLLAMTEDPDKPGEDADPLAFSKELSKSAKQGEELLRALSMFGHRFYVVGVDTSLSLDLVKLMFEAVWFHFHGVVSSVLERPHMDVESVLICLDVVRYAISAATFLNMRTERCAFATQLAKFRQRMSEQAARAEEAASSPTVEGRRRSLLPQPPVSPPASPPTSDSGTGSSEYKREAWFQAVENATPAEADIVIAQVHCVVRDLEKSVHEAFSREELQAVAKRLRNFSLLEGERRFIREGDLVKICKSGKRVTYRFFLFSDMLLYAHSSFSGEWKVHEQLLLNVLKVTTAKDRNDNRFQLHHPKKSFAVVAESVDAKRAWVRDIGQAADACLRARIETTKRSSMIASSRQLVSPTDSPEHARRETTASSIPGQHPGRGRGNVTPPPVPAQNRAVSASPRGGQHGTAAKQQPTVGSAVKSTPFNLASVKRAASRLVSPRVTGGPGHRASASAVPTSAIKLLAVRTGSGSSLTMAETERPAEPQAATDAPSPPANALPGDLSSKASPPLTNWPGPTQEEPLDADLVVRFNRGTNFFSKVTDQDVKSGMYREEDLLRAYGYVKQAKYGDCPDESPAAGADGVKMAAWSCHKGMHRRDAIHAFLALLCQLAPHWDQPPSQGSLSAASK